MTRKEKGSARKSTNNLVALGSAAVLAVYSAGYVRTRGAAERFAGETAERRPALPSARVASANEATTQPLPSAAVTPVQKGVVAGQPPRDTPRPASAQAVDSTTPALPATPATFPVDSSPAPVSAKSADTTVKIADTVRVGYKDGTYSGWGTSRHGDIEATVEVKNGKIISAAISQCRTRYSCSWIAALPPQVVARQSAETDYVSGATQSTNAFYYAVVEALTKAK